jgi:hypothetical protein
MRSRTGRALAALALAAGFILVAFAGISVAVLGDARDGHSAQAPLGTLSANDENRTSGDEALPRENAGQPGGGEGIGQVIAPAAERPASLPSTESASGGGGSPDSLPFTGLLAIPILLVGVAMLGTGLLLRRRRATGAAA